MKIDKMECSAFGECGSCTLYDFNYEEQLEYKIKKIKKLFQPLKIKKWEVFRSKAKHYRNRSEFRIWHQDEKMDYAMYGFDKKPIIIKSCPKADESINSLMPKIKDAIAKNDILKRKLFSIEFLSTASEMLVTLVYHKHLDDEWVKEAENIEKVLNIILIGRSRGVKKVLSRDFVKDNLYVNGKNFTFLLYEGAFSQPNRYVNEQMIGWVQEMLSEEGCKDLLELYCGHGNFTIPLSEKFNRVFATEISKKSIASAKENIKINKIENTTFVRLSAEELTKALQKIETFKRLREVALDSFDFSHVFVDPPRAGLDDKSLNLISSYENIIYISCNPETLARDLKLLKKSHKIEHAAIFDQFAYTNHVECGVILTSLKAAKR